MNTLKDMYLKILGSSVLFVLVFMFNSSDKVNRSQIENREHLLTEYHDKIKNEFGSNSYDSSSVNVRKNLILSGLDFASSSYFVGVGAGSFESKILKGENKYSTYGMPNPHNYFIEVFSQYGILITLFILSLFIFIGWKVLLSLFHSIAFEESLFILLLIICYGLLSNANSSFLPLPLNWFMFSLILILFDKFYSKDGIKY
jgi:O-antigen ligase